MHQRADFGFRSRSCPKGVPLQRLQHQRHGVNGLEGSDRIEVRGNGAAQRAPRRGPLLPCPLVFEAYLDGTGNVDVHIRWQMAISAPSCSRWLAGSAEALDDAAAVCEEDGRHGKEQPEGSHQRLSVPVGILLAAQQGDGVVLYGPPRYSWRQGPDLPLALCSAPLRNAAVLPVNQSR